MLLYSLISYEDINTSVFGEEFFHLYQDLYYDGLATNIGRSNIEFEAKLYHDILHQGQCCIAFFGGDILQEYLDWLTTATDWFTKMPKWEDLSDKYFYFVEAFTQEKSEYNYPVDYSMQPGSLLSLEDCLD